MYLRTERVATLGDPYGFVVGADQCVGPSREVMKIELDTRDRSAEELVISEHKSNRSYTTNPPSSGCAGLRGASRAYKDVFSLLKAKVPNPSKISAIAFENGPGSFTGLRVGAAIANALRYGLGLARPDDVLLPQYGKEPNIGGKRKAQSLKRKATA